MYMKLGLCTYSIKNGFFENFKTFCNLAIWQFANKFKLGERQKKDQETKGVNCNNQKTNHFV